MKTLLNIIGTLCFLCAIFGTTYINFSRTEREHLTLPLFYVPLFIFFWTSIIGTGREPNESWISNSSFSKKIDVVRLFVCLISAIIIGGLICIKVLPDDFFKENNTLILAINFTLQLFLFILVAGKSFNERINELKY
jgi:hypothetical protein